MTDQEKLYETFGELLYVIAKADGVVQDEERDSISEILKDHAWAKEIKWSFDYEEGKENSVEDLYKKVISVSHKIGPSPIYNEFIAGMNAVAKANKGIDESEAKKISSFSADLIARFIADIEKVNDRN